MIPSNVTRMKCEEQITAQFDAVQAVSTCMLLWCFKGRGGVPDPTEQSVTLCVRHEALAHSPGGVHGAADNPAHFAALNEILPKYA